MNYFKNVELARIYSVSEKAVRNWINAAREGKLDLTIFETGKRKYIANTPKNLAVIKELVRDRKKYVNKQTSKIVTPKKNFYNAFNKSHIFDIINNLEFNREIPLKYSYFCIGAEYWIDYVKQVIDSDIPSIPTMTAHLLELNKGYIDGLLEKYDRINIICLGAESHLSIRRFVTDVERTGKLGRYIVTDVSKGLLDFAKKDLKRWFNNRVDGEFYTLDMDYDHFDDLIVSESLREDFGKTINIVLQIGSTIYNGRSPQDILHTIRQSMNGNDIFIHDLRLGREPRFGLNHGLLGTLTPRHRLVVEMLNIDESNYDIEHYYDERLKVRLIRIRLRLALAIEFEFLEGKRSVYFNKGDAITVFRYWHNTNESTLKELMNAHFNVLLASNTDDLDYLLTVSTVKNGVI